LPSLFDVPIVQKFSRNEAPQMADTGDRRASASPCHQYDDTTNTNGDANEFAYVHLAA
jgi:hypothetical protein